MINNPKITNLVLSKNQTGVVLLVFLLVLIVGSSYAFLATVNNKQVQDINKTRQALNIAKQALISFSVTFPDRQRRGPGYLPCPDKNNDGGTEGTCTLTDTGNPIIGWFPFKLLEVQDLRDYSGARLWYAVSENHRSFLNPPTYVLNSETEGTLTSDGHSNIVAIIIAPGEILGHQIRRSSDDSRTDIQQYLEGDNKEFTTHFVTTLGGTKKDNAEYDADGRAIFNDQLVFITQQELMESAEKRVLGEIKQVFSIYQQSFDQYPWLAPFADPSTATLEIQASTSMVDCALVPGSTDVFRAQVNTYAGHIPLCDTDATVINPWFPKWFIANEWHHLAYIAYAGEDIPGGSVACTIGVCLQIDGFAVANNKIRALAVLAGADLATARPSDNLSDYFEGQNATPLDGVFQHGNITSSFNDQIKFIPIVPATVP